MVFDQVFQRFLDESPTCVMLRATMECIFSPEKLDAVFHEAAERQYERELLFSSLVDMTSWVVCRVAPSVRQAKLQMRERIPVSLEAVYDKLKLTETGTSRALVQHTAREVGEVIQRTGGCCQPLLPGYRTRILDGNHLSGTEHRLGVLRGTAAGALPGQALVLLDPEKMLISDVFPCADGHAQERSLLGEVLPIIGRRDLLIADRNFCTVSFLVRLARKHARFIVRQHGRMPCRTLGKRRYLGKCKTGRVYEQAALVMDPEMGQEVQVRRITVELKKATRDGDTEIHLLTNLPTSKANAIKIAKLYARRWTLENAFHQLTVYLRCELNSLGYPPAALFAFCVAVCCYNLLAAVKGALRSQHGEKKMEEEVSTYSLTEEISTVYRGMMVALPAEEWKEFREMRLPKLAEVLKRWAQRIDLDQERYRKHVRGPKKVQPKRPNAQFQHVSTAKLLLEHKENTRLKAKKLVGASP